MLRHILREALGAIRKNLLPGFVLQCLLVIFVVAYFCSAGFRDVLGVLADWKKHYGFFFSFVIYVFAAGLLPEILRVLCFQRGKILSENRYRALVLSLFWGTFGIIADLLYRCQGIWFGNGAGWGTLLRKLIVDQFIFAPFFAAPLTATFLLAVNIHFDRRKFLSSALSTAHLDSIITFQSASWLVWIPAVLVIYSLPPLLQIPIAGLISAFWSLTVTTLFLLRK